jgi:hypothetical protein
VFDARWTIITTNGILRNIFPDNVGPDVTRKRIAWKATFQAGNLSSSSPNYPVVVKWSKTDALKAPHTIYFEDQFWNDSTNTGLYRINMKTGTYVAGTGVDVSVSPTNSDTMIVRFTQVNIDGFKIVYDFTSGVDPIPAVAGSFTLSANIPNPFAKSTEISFFAPIRGEMRLDVFDAKGDLVNTLVNGMTEAGSHTAVWNGADAHGKAVPSGSYIYRLTTGSTVLSKTMVLVR